MRPPRRSSGPGATFFLSRRFITSVWPITVTHVVATAASIAVEASVGSFSHQAAPIAPISSSERMT